MSTFTESTATQFEKQKALEQMGLSYKMQRTFIETWQAHQRLITLLLLLAVIFMVIIFFTMQHVKISHQYKDMITWIDTLRKNGSYTDPGSGYQFAFWYHYPHLPMVEFTNINFPAAVVYSFYSPEISHYFVNSDTSLAEMFKVQTALGEATSVQIICQWVRQYVQGAGVPNLCQQICPMPQLYTAAEATSTIATQGLMFAMIGTEVLPGIGTIIGLGVGMGIGAAQSSSQKSQIDQQCNYSQQNCQSSSTYACGTVVT